MRFTIAQIEAFSSIVDTGSFSAAARRLNLTQPTISQRIRELESAIGASLFFRRGPRILLTPEGQALVDYSSRVLGAAGDLAAHFQGRNPLKGVLRLGVPSTFAVTCMTELLMRLDRRYPNLKASVQISDSATMEQMLEAHQLDIAILVEPVSSARVRQQPLGNDELAWAASPDLHLPRTLRPADLAELHVMLTPSPSRLRVTVMDWFAAAGSMPTRLSTCNNLTVLLQTLSSGLAVGVLPLRILQPDITAGRLRHLQVTPPLPPHRMVICHQTEGLGPGVHDVVALMRDLIAEHALFD